MLSVESKYSLNSDEFRQIEQEWKESIENNRKNVPRIPDLSDPLKALEEFKKDLYNNMKRFLSAYGMGYITNTRYKDGRVYIRHGLTPETQKYVLYQVRYSLERSDNLKPAYFIQGKRSEAALMMCLNDFLYFFGQDSSPIILNSNSRFYGGDGGYDLVFGMIKLDPKNRDDNPNSGMALSRRSVESWDDDVILVQTTNVSNIKLGEYFTNKLKDVTMDKVIEVINENLYPIAITGWITVGEFKERMKRLCYLGNDERMVVDDLNDISELFIKVVEESIASSNLFSYS